MSDVQVTAETPEKLATLKEIREYFNTPARPMATTDMKKEWVPLSAAEKLQFQKGLADGSLTY